MEAIIGSGDSSSMLEMRAMTSSQPETHHTQLMDTEARVVPSCHSFHRLHSPRSSPTASLAIEVTWHLELSRRSTDLHTAIFVSPRAGLLRGNAGFPLFADRSRVSFGNCLRRVQLGQRISTRTLVHLSRVPLPKFSIRDRCSPNIYTERLAARRSHTRE